MVEKTMCKSRLALNKAFEEMRKKGGRARKLSVLGMLIGFFAYYHDYRTMENIGFDCEIHKQRISKAIAWVEGVLITDGTFSLPSKRELVNPETEIAIVIVDATEQETERPPKNSVSPIQANKNAAP
jgi:hypothetical protein